MRKDHNRLLYLTELAVLTGIMLFLEITGLGMIKTFGLELTILQIPVIIAAIVIGPSGGAALGAVFGLISFWECFGKSPFGAQLLGINPYYTFLVCVPPRILMGWLCGLIFKGMHSRLGDTRGNFASYITASLSGALLNTVFFMSALCLCFYQTDYIQGFVQSMGSSNVLVFVLMFVGIQGLVEAVLCASLGSLISKGVRKGVHRSR